MLTAGVRNRTAGPPIRDRPAAQFIILSIIFMIRLFCFDGNIYIQTAFKGCKLVKWIKHEIFQSV